MNSKNLPYRACTGVMLLNPDDKVFVGRRIDTALEAWQMPQGGIDDGEAPEETAFRELEEEIGTSNAKIITHTKDWLYYDLPDELVGKIWGGKYRGQKQIWFLMRFLGDASDINIETDHPEFHAWKWVDIKELPKLIVPFKRPIYEALVKEFSPYIGSDRD